MAPAGLEDPTASPAREAAVVWGFAALCLLYAALRYVGFGGHSVQQLPAWVMNTALAAASVGALGLGLRARRHGREAAARRYLEAFKTQAMLHVLLTLALLGPGYFGDLFQGARMGWRGELAVLAGCVTAVQLSQGGRLGRVGLLGAAGVLLVHVGAVGAPGWLPLAHWHGGMPPISLLAFLGTGWLCFGLLRP